MDKSNKFRHSHSQDAELAKGKIALKAFFTVTRLWDCSPVEEAGLLGVSIQRLEALRRCEPTILDGIQAARISSVLGVEAALMLIYGDARLVAERVRQETSELPFDHQSPLAFMAAGPSENLALAKRFYNHRANFLGDE